MIIVSDLSVQQPVKFTEAEIAMPDKPSKRLSLLSSTELSEQNEWLQQRVADLEDQLVRQQKIGSDLGFSVDAYRMIVENTLSGICIIQDSKICFANPALSRIMGYSEEELSSRPFIEFAHPQYRGLIMERHLSRLGGHKGDNNYPAKFISANGDHIWLITQASAVMWQGRPAVMSFIQDITEQKKAQEELERGANRLSLIVDNIPTPVFVIDKQHRITHWNKACQALTGASEEDVIRTQRHSEIFYGSKRPILADLIVDGTELHEIEDLYGPDYEFSRLIPGAVGAERFFPHLGEKGVWLTFLAAPLRDSDGKTIGAIETLFDTTERKDAEEAVRQSESRYLTLFRNISDAIFLLRGEEVIDFNPAGAEMFKLAGDQNDSIDPWSLSPPHQPDGRDSMAVLKEKVAKAFAGQSQNFEWTHRRTNGNTFSSEVNLTRMPGLGETLLLALIRDISERKVAEEEKRVLEQQLRHSQKMESLGTLAGGIAHDFNNILGAVMGYSELALERVIEQGDNTDEIGHVLHAAERAKKLVRQILTFGRKMTSERDLLDFNYEITRGIELLRNLIPKMIDLTVNLDNQNIVIRGDSTQLEQVLVNLGVNAADAMPEGGSLVIETKLMEADEAYCHGRPDLRPGKYVLLSVKDSGHGMDEEVKNLIFDPFFTTKEVGRGTGLGLSTVYGIVKGHGGRISCISEKNAGTEFRAYFPAMDEPVKKIEPKTKQFKTFVKPSEGLETILVVDDEAALRNVARGALEREGYHVFTAASGEEALSLYSEVGSKIDLVILDVGMPGMGGVMCLDELREIEPNVLVLVVSGYSPEGPLMSMMERNPSGYLAKPFRVAQLLEQVRQLLNEE